MNKKYLSKHSLIYFFTLLLPLSAFAVKGPQIITGNYLMAFHACDSSQSFVASSCSGSLAAAAATAAASSGKASTSTSVCGQASDFTTYLAQSNDGSSWTTLSSWNNCSFTASVPDVIRRDDVIYVYAVFSSQIYVTTVNTVTGAVSAAQLVNVVDSLGNTENLVDPSPLLVRDGTSYKIVLAYLQNNNTGGDPATCSSFPCTQIFKTATESGSFDGTSFVVDSGNRVEVTLNSSTETASDPDLFWTPEGYVILVARGGGIQAYRSSTLYGSYSTISTLTDGYLVNYAFPDSFVYNLSTGLYDNASASYFIYSIGLSTTGQTPQIRMATLTNLNSTISDSDFSTVIDPSTYTGLGSNYIMSSPGIAPNRRNATR